MTENVFNILTGKQIDQHVADEKLIEEARQILEIEEADKERDECIELLQKAMALVEAGRLRGLVLIGIDPATDYFFNEIRLGGPSVGRHNMFGYMGILDALKIELFDASSMSPTISVDGNVVDPFDAMEDYDEYEEYDE